MSLLSRSFDKFGANIKKKSPGAVNTGSDSSLLPRIREQKANVNNIMQEISKILNSTNTSTKNLPSVNSTNTSTNKTIGEVRLIATRLEEKLGQQVPSRYKYYCKVAWRLPEAIIWSNLEEALTNETPAKLFAWLCKPYLDQVEVDKVQ